MPRKTRRELKEMFKKGAQPTAEDYADKIDSQVNILDDGVDIPQDSNLPMRIKAKGPRQNLLDFYDGNDQQAWRINQLPEDNKPGFNIEDHNQNSWFFIQQGTGNVGLGTNEPEARLHISNESLQGDSFRVDDVANDTTPFRVSNNGSVHINKEQIDTDINLEVNGAVNVRNDAAGTTLLDIKKNGAIGIGTEASGTAPNVRIGTDLVVAGKLTVHEEIDIKSTVSGKGNDILLGDNDEDVTTIRGKLNSGHSSGKLEVEDDVNITGTLEVSGGATVTGSVTANSLSGSGANITTLNGSNISSGTVPIAHTPYSTDNNLGNSNDLLPTQRAVKQYVDAAIPTVPDTIPSGVIVMWSGTANDIPAGWRLYDELKDKFVIGCGGKYTSKDTGGSETATLTVNNMPSHNHIAWDKGHTHTMIGTDAGGSGWPDDAGNGDWKYLNGVQTGYADIEVGFTGGGQSFSIMPPFYALCYIIKL